MIDEQPHLRQRSARIEHRRRLCQMNLNSQLLGDGALDGVQQRHEVERIHRGCAARQRRLWLFAQAQLGRTCRIEIVDGRENDRLDNFASRHVRAAV